MWLFKKRGRQAPIWFLYLQVMIGMLYSYMLLSMHRSADMTANLIALFISSSFMLLGIAKSFSRFVKVLQRPYQGGNLHVALSSVLTTAVMFAAIYSILYLYLPNAFSGLSGNTPLDECVNVIYFSVTTLATVGFGDIYPTATIAKVFVSIEMMSFFVFFVLILGNHRVFIKPKEEPGQIEEKDTDVSL
ncbi:MAG: ion channel [Firmicutes bacterium]|nr:ion channel [Bacillota bacterium]